MPQNPKPGRHNSPAAKARRERFEAELSAIPRIPPAFLKLSSPEGFADYYLEIRDLYPSCREAYERLEDFYLAATDRRRYAEFDSFRTVLRRQLKRCREAGLG